MQKLEAVLTFFHAFAQHRRLVFASRIEQEASASFDHAAQAMLFERSADFLAALSQISLERIQRMKIERDGNAFVAKLRENGDRVLEAMMREAIRVVAQEHHGTASM